MKGPKVKFTRKIILDNAVKFIDKKGLINLSSRNLAKFIGCSTQPIFKVYEGMEELLNDVYVEIDNIHNSYVENARCDIPFLNYGMGYIRFANDHPNLFSAKFMNENIKKESLIDFFSDDESEELLKIMSKKIGISEDSSRELLRNIWISTHGIACFITTGQVKYNEEEIKSILMNTFIGNIKVLKEKESRDYK